MSKPKETIRSILGVDVWSQSKSNEGNLEKYFLKPIIHKNIQGNEVYVPLNLDRIWFNT